MLNIPIKDYFRETRIFNSRLSFTAVIVLLLCLTLLVRLVHLQVVSHTHYATLSQDNRINPVPIPPVRGMILDTNGVVLAQNYPAFTLEITPDQVDDMGALLGQLGGIIQLNETDLENFRKLLRTRPSFESLPLRTRLSDEEAARIAIQRPHLQGVELHARLQRHYPLGELGIHFVGYVGRINDEEMETINTSAYRGTQHIGKLGVERSYEDVLLGRVGIKSAVINAHGRGIGALEDQRIAPVAGKNIYLNIDAGMQALAENELGERRGAVVAMNPINGAILTFASTPTYDPNPFVNGIDVESYDALLENPDKPLINRALNGQYAPGSTIKPFLGLAALETGVFDTKERINCQGSFTLPGTSHRFRDWKKKGHGRMDLHDAIVQSCDVYFYNLAVGLGIDAMTDFLSRFGLGRKTGIDLLLESSGLVPSPEWKQSQPDGEPWYLGETVVTGIGQGPFLVTPLQLVSAVSVLANEGVRMRPRIVRATEDPITHELRDNVPEAATQIILSNEHNLDLIVQSMADVVHGEGGTGRRIGWDAKYKIAGKTGTAQVISIGQEETYDAETTPERLRDHALFIAFAPVDSPQLAVAVIVENGGGGSVAAAPIARKILDFYLLKRDKQGPARQVRGG